MRKIKIILVSLGLLCLILPAQAAILSGDATTNLNNNLNNSSSALGYNTMVTFEQTVSTIIQLVLGVIGTIFLVLMFVAGNNWMQAAGNEEKVKKSKETIRDLLIGLCLILVAYAFSSGLATILTKVLLKNNS